MRGAKGWSLVNLFIRNEPYVELVHVRTEQEFIPHETVNFVDGKGPCDVRWGGREAKHPKKKSINEEGEVSRPGR